MGLHLDGEKGLVSQLVNCLRLLTLLAWRLLLCFILPTGAVAIGACGSNHDRAIDPHAESPTAVAPEDYFSLFPFDLDWLHQAIPANAYPSKNDEGKYQSAVATVKQQGIESLSPQDLRLLLLISWYARLMQEHAVQYSVIERDQYLTPTRIDEWQEQYEFVVGYGLDSAVPSPVETASRIVYALVPKALYPGASPPPDEKLYVNELTGPQNVTETEWQRRGQSWTCARGSGSAVLLWAWMLHLGINPGLVDAVPVGMDSVNGRAAYKLKAAPTSAANLHGGTPMFYWLDAETLLPVQEESDIGNGNTSLVTLQELNPGIDILPPDEDVPCATKDFNADLP